MRLMGSMSTTRKRSDFLGTITKIALKKESGIKPHCKTSLESFARYAEKNYGRYKNLPLGLNPV